MVREQIGNTEQLHVTSRQSRSTRLDLYAWADGTLELCAAQPGPRKTGGWSFLLVFHGEQPSIATRQIVDAYEESLLVVSPYVRKPECHQDVLALWSFIEPVVERLVPATE